MTTGWWRQRVLWIDGLAALSAGLFVLALRGVLATLYVLPLDLITIIGIVNLGYSAFSLTLASRPRSARPMTLIVSLAAANGVWACVCAFLVMRHWSAASLLGLAHIAFEGAFVLALAAIEWRNRHLLGRSVAASIQK